MTANKSAMNMPELRVFAKPLVIGFIIAEVWRAAFYLGSNFTPALYEVASWVKTGGVLVVLLICLIYIYKRGAFAVAARMGHSRRLDLLAAMGVGIWANELASPWLAKPHAALQNADPYWAPAIVLLLCIMLLSPLVRYYWPRPKRTIPQQHFIADEEVKDKSEDLLENESQAKSFADAVLESGAHPGLIFGVEGPWGVGKTSFINLAERYWAEAEDRVIVCRFEPLRYASEPDLADRLIRDLSGSIQRKAFAPEFRPAASRYSRLIKGKADVSFLGFKLSLQPSQETVDELLDDINEVLKRIGRRVIIVIDDLDRLDAKTTNNVLFATRQTFKLSQATYVLSYDTEVLAGGQEEGLRAREFLEKFVTVKLSLFVDSSSIRDFLRRDWQQAENHLGSIPPDTMVKLGTVLNELADILDGEFAAKYLPLVGDMRKVKRFVNAMLLMQIEKSELGRTDFNKRDLINLILLHLHYPGLFRRIYAEETQGRIGSFSVYHEWGERRFKNSPELSTLVEAQPDTAKFLLKQLFDVDTLQLGDSSTVDEAVWASRACFNQDSFRNLEDYLKLIVRFATPEPQETFVLYQKAVEQVRKGISIASVLRSPEFRLERGEHAHDQFWRVLVNQSNSFTQAVAEGAIDTLIDYLPCYSSITNYDQGLRQRSIYSLLLLLDRAGWGGELGRRPANTPENIEEIAWRVFGERSYQGKGLIQRLASADRGALGWNDLMLFRLQCSADRQGQLHNLQSALIIHTDKNAKTTGLVSDLALMGMRKLSQEVFALFKRAYIDPEHNFFEEAGSITDDALLGADKSLLSQSDLKNSNQFPQNDNSLEERFSRARTSIKTFVIYQLSNSFRPHGSGVGCGYYDEHGDADGNGVAKLMNDYVFGVCFNPSINEDNVFHFLDYCLSNLNNSFFLNGSDEGCVATKAGLSGGLDSKEMGVYWNRHKELIRQLAQQAEDRNVATYNYTASYSEDLKGVFDVLDGLSKEISELDV
ncbi:KAP family NTPase [Vreelandella arcis]|uniref:KAP family P-loop domain-containing protein n=1 Tax=Vreelandella arcis TaxID=416873 RepID=A0A1H0ALY2_9GAMM|nr:KAP family NTPase [Halomonas arcis]SDN34550.1 KAP family P-loop domain-containing protein [Halomonas arcis]